MPNACGPGRGRRRAAGMLLAAGDICFRVCQDGRGIYVDRRGDCPPGAACRGTGPPGMDTRVLGLWRAGEDWWGGMWGDPPKDPSSTQHRL